MSSAWTGAMTTATRAFRLPLGARPRVLVFEYTVPLHLRHVYFDDHGAAHPLSQARFTRVFDLDTREAISELAGRRVRFLTLFVWFEDDLPLEVSQTEASVVTFDDDGRRDQAKANRERRSAARLLDQSDEPSPNPSRSPEVVLGLHLQLLAYGLGPRRRETRPPSTTVASADTTRPLAKGVTSNRGPGSSIPSWA